MNAATAKKPSKPKAKPIRTVSILSPMTAEGLNGIIRLSTNGKVEEYFLDRIDADFGEGFVMEKRFYDFKGEDTRYAINLNERKSSCECMGFLAHGHCKHLECLQALKRADKL